MRERGIRVAVLVALVVFCAGAITAQDIKKPEPTVPEIFTLTGQFVRVAYNNEGYVTLGYRVANDSVAEDWMLLEVGVTLRAPTKAQTMTRDSLSLMLPDGSTIGLATQKEFGEAGHLPALNTRGNMIRDSINYFPVQANQPCVIGFFSDPTNRVRSIAFDQVELSSNRACMGRIFFKVPGQIQTGQHYLLVKFDNSMIEVPFRILTKAEEKEFKKNWKSLKKEHDAEYKQ
jgi:hypothetical protein